MNFRGVSNATKQKKSLGPKKQAVGPPKVLPPSWRSQRCLPLVHLQSCIGLWKRRRTDQDISRAGKLHFIWGWNNPQLPPFVFGHIYIGLLSLFNCIYNDRSCPSFFRHAEQPELSLANYDHLIVQAVEIFSTSSSFHTHLDLLENSTRNPSDPPPCCSNTVDASSSAPGKSFRNPKAKATVWMVVNTLVNSGISTTNLKTGELIPDFEGWNHQQYWLKTKKVQFSCQHKTFWILGVWGKIWGAEICDQVRHLRCSKLP